MNNTYSKFYPNVWVLKTDIEFKKDDTVEITTKYGKVNEHIIHNLVKKTDENLFYSITRSDGFDSNQRAKNKAEKYNNWKNSQDAKSTKYYEDSKEGHDFLVLAEPIKIGHHSENRHRALIDRNYKRMGKSVEASDKAKAHEQKANYWESQTDKIDLSMPESIEYFDHKMNKAIELHKLLKDKPELREHSYSLTYANKDRKEMIKKYEIAKLLWE